METGCDAVIGWRDPARFRRCVCPLLAKTPDGRWVCSVDASRVRPFWGRAAFFFGGTALFLAVLAGGGVFLVLRGIGYGITPRQVFWPPAWHELADAKVQLFIKQAEGHLREGRMREAMRALSVANQLAPDNYAAAMMLAQLYRAGNPAAAERIYLRMSQQHPRLRNETARHWFAALLAQGRLDDVAELARRQLVADKSTGAWLHALLFSCRELNRFEPLDAVVADAKVPPAVRGVASLEVRVRRATREQAQDLLRDEPLPPDFPYARLHRAHLLVEFGQSREAIALLAASRGILAGRDLLPAALAAYAVAGEEAALTREVRSLLGPAAADAELGLVAAHLVRHPDRALSELLANAWQRLPVAMNAERNATALGLLCAVGASGDRANFDGVRASAIATRNISPAAADRLQQFFFSTAGRPPVEALLASMIVMPLELNYAMLERYRK